MTAKLNWDEVAISKFWDYYSQFPEAYFESKKRRQYFKIGFI